MAQKRGTVFKGTALEFGAVRAGVDVSFGPTTRDGFAVSFGGNDLVVKGGLSTLPLEQFPVDDDVEISATMLGGDLALVREMLGIVAAVTGDLSAGTQEELIVEFNGTVRQREDQLYALVEGPNGKPRRFDFARCKVKAGSSLTHNSEKEMNVPLKYTLLQPKDASKPMRMKDIP